MIARVADHVDDAHVFFLFFLFLVSFLSCLIVNWDVFWFGMVEQKGLDFGRFVRYICG